jgi:hypothetical protein
MKTVFFVISIVFSSRVCRPAGMLGHDPSPPVTARPGPQPSRVRRRRKILNIRRKSTVVV